MTFMRSRVSELSDDSLRLKVQPRFPSSSPDILDDTGGSLSHIRSPLMERSPPIARLTWKSDAADLFILLCSFLLTTTSIILVALIFHTQVANPWDPEPTRKTLLTLQRIISSLSAAVASAVIMVAGKRYVLFKLARGGLRTNKVAVYSNPSLGNLAIHLALHGIELPLLGLSVVWSLALATGLTVNDSWGIRSISDSTYISVPFGPLNPPTLGSSWLTAATEQLAFVTLSFFFGGVDAVGLIHVTSSNVATNHPMGTIYYPPLPYSAQKVGFSFSTAMNGFNISMEPLSSVPSSAQSLTCVPSIIVPYELWFDGSDDQSLSIIATAPLNTSSIFRFNATAVIMGGTLSSTGNYTEFARNGTSWPNVMSADSQWAQDITNLICNTTISTAASSSLSDFATLINSNAGAMDGNEPYSHWSTVLSMALGAYSSANLYSQNTSSSLVTVTFYDAKFTSQYGTYILLLNILVSLAMLVVVVKLRLGSRLGPDFINSTRLLLDPLKKPELFNASLEATADALGNPYMLVREDNEFLLGEQKPTRETRKWVGSFSTVESIQSG